MIRPSFDSSRRRKRWPWITLFVVFTLLVSGVVALDRWQRTLIFSVELGEPRWWREPPANTREFDIPLGSSDTIRAWHVPHPDPDAPTVLYLHGSRWNLNGSVFRMERWRDVGFSILAIDYRGFGESTPRLPSEASALVDARAAFSELERLQPEAGKRYLYGHSLGGPIAARLAAEVPQDAYAGLILEATFTRIADMLEVTEWARWPALRWLVTQPFDTTAALRQVQRPVLLMHGTGDRVVPLAMQDGLWAARPDNAPAWQRAIFEGSSHSGSSRHPDYGPTIREFLEQDEPST